MPCPYCGQAMTSETGSGVVFGGGLVGLLLAKAFRSTYRCATHGEIPKAQLPQQHKTMATIRSVLLTFSAIVLFITVLSCLIGIRVAI